MIPRRVAVPLTVAFLLIFSAAGADRFRLSTYNVENYILADTATRKAKPEASRARVAEIIRSLEADVLALQEVGGEAALADIQSRVRALGLNYPHSAWAQGWDTNIQVALLSRAPIVSRRVHAQDSYLVSGRRFRVSRGILEADIQLTRDYRVTVFTAHLKSRREVPDADQAAMRAAEARILREKIDARLKEDPNANILVLGDLNDTKDSLPVRTIFGRGRHRLVDTRPAERNGDTGYSPNPRHDPRTVTWTHYYGVEDAYGRIDYILAHPNAARELVEGGAMIPSVPNWGVASDHRPILVTIEARDR